MLIDCIRFLYQTFDVEMELRKSLLEDTVEMGAAMATNTTDESMKYSIDDRINKLKAHWEQLCLKLNGQKKLLHDINEDWSAFEDLRIQLDSWIRDAEAYYVEAAKKELGSTVTELEEHLLKHKVCSVFIGLFASQVSAVFEL